VYEHPTTAFVAGFVGRNNFWQGVATEHGAQADDGTVFVASRPEEDVPNGEPALSAVRPECIHLTSAQPSQAENVVQARVAGVSYYGDVLQYVVRTRTRDLLVLVPRTNPARFALDDSVWCSWSAEDVYLFSARQASVVMASPSGSV
jgi:ABC-type Fe3+/spermidine/putrescine transport system ATPase subunit